MKRVHCCIKCDALALQSTVTINDHTKTIVDDQSVKLLGECYIALWGEPNELSIQYRIYIFIQYVDS